MNFPAKTEKKLTQLVEQYKMLHFPLTLLFSFFCVFFIGFLLMKKAKQPTLDVYLFRKECS